MTQPADLLAALDPEQRQVAEALRGPGAGAGGRRHGQDAGDHPPHRPRRRHRRLRPDRGAGGHLHHPGGGRDARPAARASAPAGVQARTFHSAALRQLRYFWPHVHGTELPTLTESKIAMIVAAARRHRLNTDQAMLRDLASEVEWAKVSNVHPDDYARLAAAPRSLGGQPRRRDRRPGLRQLRGGQARPGPDGHGGRAAAHRRHARRGRAGRGAGAPPVQVVRRRRVPGRLPAPVGPARPLAGWPRRALRGGRPRPDHLLVRRRQRRPTSPTSRRSTRTPRRSSWSATTGRRRRSSTPPTACWPARPAAASS